MLEGRAKSKEKKKSDIEKRQVGEESRWEPRSWLLTDSQPQSGPCQGVREKPKDPIGSPPPPVTENIGDRRNATKRAYEEKSRKENEGSAEHAKNTHDTKDPLFLYVGAVQGVCARDRNKHKQTQLPV